MKPNRRSFLKAAALGLGAATLAPTDRAAAADAPPRGTSRLRLGTVTYNLAKDWDLATLIRNCEQARFEGVELRTTHAHGVEVSLSPAQRAEVRKRFEDSSVELMGLGSAFDYHTPDPARLRQDLEATKAYIILAHDVGASGVKVRPNAFPASVPREKTIEQIGAALNELGRFAANHGQVIRLEVHGAETSLLPNIRKIIDVADHPHVGVCWNSNDNDLAGDGFDHNFDLVKHKLNAVHMRDLYLENYPFRRLLRRLNETNYTGFCLAEIPESNDPIRVMRYYRALFLAYQDLL
ncbi:MAG: sugar phosphate isomerase/epimerase [Verrucomicrobia bacterium]|nr:sugar phosphate isomerase/epimerase [Verrucomicrobiota bacterium]